MSDLLKTGLAWLTTKLKDHASQAVTYARGYDSVDVQATLGQKLLQLDDGTGGIRMEWTDLDFLIPAADLTFDGVTLVIPERGDIIYLVVGSLVESFEVFPFGAEPPWRWADPHQSMLRIHGKHIGEEPYVL